MTTQTSAHQIIQDLEFQFDNFIKNVDEFIDSMYFEMESGIKFQYVVYISTDSWDILTNENEFSISLKPTISFPLPKPDEIEYINGRYHEVKRRIRKRFNEILTELY